MLTLKHLLAARNVQGTHKNSPADRARYRTPKISLFEERLWIYLESDAPRFHVVRCPEIPVGEAVATLSNIGSTASRVHSGIASLDSHVS